MGYCNGCGLEVEFQKKEVDGLEIWICPKCCYRIIRFKPGKMVTHNPPYKKKKVGK